MSYQWSKSDPRVGEGFLRIAREQIGKATDWAENTSEPAEKRVHEARRRCKKLRALFRLVRPGFPAYGEANPFVRDAARDLAVHRDTRVLRNTLSDLMARAGRPIEVPGEPPHSETEAERVALAQFAMRMRELDGRAAGWRLDQITLATLATGLRQTYRWGRRTRRTALRHRTDEAFHEWRKYAKYHWNQLGLLEECAPDVLPSAQRSAGDLAELLGLHHDLAVLSQVLDKSPADLGVEVDAQFVREALNRRQDELEAQIDGLGRQVFAEKPRALEARFGAYLTGWSTSEAAA